MPVTSWMLRRGSLLLLQVTIVTLCVCVTTLVAVRVQEAQIRSATVQRVTDVAESLAQLPAVIAGMAEPGDTEVLQPLADLVQEASGVDYVVITDAEGVRMTHPNPALVGLPVSTDPTAVLRGETFIGTQDGTLGRTLRAKVPVVSNGEVVGGASVGLLEQHIDDDLVEAVGELGPWVLGSLVFGFVAATAVDRAVRRRVSTLETELRELEVQRRLTAVLREQTHEFTNRLHVLYGLVEADARGEALDFIGTLVPVTRGAEALVADPRLAAVLAAHAAELARGGGELRLVEGSAAHTGFVSDAALTVTANLLANAVEATDGGGRVDVLVNADRTGFSVSVYDDGPGFDLGPGSRLFERGFSTKQGARRGGVEIPRGVGLSLVRDLVRRHRGVLDVGDSPANGARVSVTLPGTPVETGQP
jgi:two-component system CitB family sensor kinase